MVSLTSFCCHLLGQVKGQLPRASIDKEIAASLLDLSKGTDDVCKMTTTSAKSGLTSVHSTTGHSGTEEDRGRKGRDRERRKGEGGGEGKEGGEEEGKR